MIIFKQTIQRILKNKIRLIVLLFMPLLFIAMFAIQDERSLTIGVVDKDQSRLSNKLISSLSEMYKVKVMILEEKVVYDKAVSYQTDYTIILESGFEDKIVSGENPDVKEFYLSEKEKLFYAKNFIENYIYNMKTLASGIGFDKNKFSNALAKYDSGKLTLDNAAGADKTIPQAQQAMGFLVQFMIYMSVVTAGIISEDKNSGVFYRVFYAPVTLKRYLVENLAAFLCIGIMQVALIMIAIKLFFGIQLGSHPINMFLLFSVFSIVCISLGMWVVSLFKKPLGAYTMIVLVTTPLVMLGGCYWPMSFMPDSLQKIAKFIPTSWIMQGVNKILFEGKDITDIWLEIFVLLIFAGIFMAAGLFKKVDISK